MSEKSTHSKSSERSLEKRHLDEASTGPRKRLKAGPNNANAADKSSFLGPIKVAVATKGIPQLATRKKIWQAALQDRLAQSAAEPGVTHFLIGPATPKSDLPPALEVVDYNWLVDSLSAKQRLSESIYRGLGDKENHGKRGKAESSSESAGSATSLQNEPARPQSRHPRVAQWLGRWSPELDDLDDNELVLQAAFSEETEREVGNAWLVKLLKELYKYERALKGDQNSTGDDGIVELNYRALRYSRGAAVVRACRYKIGPDTHEEHLPFMGGVTSAEVREIAATGTCGHLEAFRADEPVTDSRGQMRWDSAGARTRLLFYKLPMVGHHTAEQWYKAGLRSYEDVEAAAEAGLVPATREQRFSLRHRADLLEDASRAEIEEMEAEVLAALRELAGEGGEGEGWQVVNVGGGRRALPSHDGDFLVSHPSRSVTGLVRPLEAQLAGAGRLIGGEAMRRVQEGRMPGHLDSMRSYLRGVGPKRDLSNLAADRYDHIFGMYLTHAGKVRRIDLIIVPHEEFPFALMGWTGSMQYLRFLRYHATTRGMYLNSHRLMRRGPDGQAFIVPDEKPPLDRNRQEYWPPGWHAGRRVQSERDIFELLGVPYREPHERNCP